MSCICRQLTCAQQGPLARFPSYLPYWILLIPHQHQLARESTPYNLCLGIISACSSSVLRKSDPIHFLSPPHSRRVIRNELHFFAMVKTDHSKGDPVSKSVGSFQPKKVAKRTLEWAKSHGRSIYCETRTILLTNLTGQMPHYAIHAPASSIKLCEGLDAAA